MLTKVLMAFFVTAAGILLYDWWWQGRLDGSMLAVLVTAPTIILLNTRRRPVRNQLRRER